jgi:hypothetical protein
MVPVEDMEEADEEPSSSGSGGGRSEVDALDFMNSFCISVMVVYRLGIFVVLKECRWRTTIESKTSHS